MEIQDSIGEGVGYMFVIHKEERRKLPLTKCGEYSESMYGNTVNNWRRFSEDKSILLCTSKISLEIAGDSNKLVEIIKV